MREKQFKMLRTRDNFEILSLLVYTELKYFVPLASGVNI